MDKDARLAILGILELSQETMKGASEARILALRIHEALVKARIPGYLETYESRDDMRFSELAEVKNKLSHVIEAGIQGLRKLCTR
jgi:hypothetical protein